MDSSGSLERIDRLRFASQTPSPSPEDADDDGAERAQRAERSDRPERGDRPERSDRAATANRTRGERASGSNLGQLVLLIEDNPEVISAVTHCLQGAGYQLQCAADVADAVRKVKSRAVALVLLDWDLLLRIGGGELIAALRENSPRAHLPMVVIADQVSALNEASSLGIEDYVLDPFQLEELLHVVDEHCV